MSIFNTIKKSLGFGNDVDDELLDDTTDAAESPEQARAERETIEQGQEHESEAIAIDRDKADMIFDRVVSVFNEALPSFLRDCVDETAQRKKLYEGLDSSLKEYIESVSKETRRQCESRWASEQASMRNEMDSLRSKAKEIEQQRFDIKQQQLSADRQKRALTDRLHDLEAQVGRLEAEREQFDLENKSLVNKLKVAGVHEAEIENLQQLLTDAKSEISRLRSGSEAAPVEDSGKISELEARNAALEEQLEAAAEKDRISTEMFNSLQSRASEARDENEKLLATIEELRKKLEEAEAYKAEVAEIGRQVEQFEEIITKRERKIEKLKDTCRTLRDEKTIADNLKTYAESEASLTARIMELEADPTVPIVASDLESYTDKAIEKAEEDAAVKISDGDLAAIEESFDSEDWMRSDPPETPSMRTGVSEAEFGYQAPTRKTPRHDNDAQLSLF